MIHGDVLGERARLSPECEALVVVAGGARYTYGDLDRRAVAAAAAVREGLALAKGDRVALLAGNRVEFLDVFFAAGKGGFVVVPLSTRATARELAVILADAEVAALIYDGAFASVIAELRPLVQIGRWIALDTPVRDEDLRWNELLGSLSPVPCPLSAASPEDPYCLLYTSGTTGKPKGVIVPHRMVAWNGLNTTACWGLREDDTSPIFTPLYHAGGLGAFLVPIFTVGGRIVLHTGFDAAEVWRTIAAERCTVVLGVPTIWKLLMEAPEFATVDLSHVRWLISGGAPLPVYLVDAYRARGVVLRQGYGLTEVGVNCFAMSSADAWRKAGSIGRPLAFTEARLVDEAGREVAVGEVGELCFRGPHVCSGYWRNAEASAAAVDGDGFFHTGDLARRDAEGFFFIAGRRKDMFISGGVNVYPAEVEAELLQHQAVQDAAVIGVPHETWGEVGAAFVVLRPGHAATDAALAEFLTGRLARYKVPKEFVFVDALPRTPYGKVVKAELSTFRAQAKGGSPDPRPRTPDPGHPAPAGLPDAGVLAHRIDGAGDPVLLLNGGMMTISSWDAVAASLARGHTVVRCDFRGQLLSPGESPPTLAGHVGDVVRLLDHLALDRVDIVATSFGAQVALLLAALEPARVVSLVAATAVDVVAPSMSALGAALVEASRAARAEGHKAEFFATLAEIVYSPAHLAAHGGELAARQTQLTTLPDAWFVGVERILAATGAMDLRPVLGQIRCPVLVVIAGGDALMPRERSEALAAAIRGAQSLTVPGSGHALVVERPQEFTDIVTAFLARHGGGHEAGTSASVKERRTP